MRGLAVEAPNRGMTVDALAAEMIAERFEPQSHRLSIAAWAHPLPTVTSSRTRECSLKASDATPCVEAANAEWVVVRTG